jgi:hypothetical protein
MLIAALIRRDAPYYDASISEATVHDMNAFCRDLGILAGAPSYGDVVATGLQSLWYTGAR